MVVELAIGVRLRVSRVYRARPTAHLRVVHFLRRVALIHVPTQLVDEGDLYGLLAPRC